MFDTFRRYWVQKVLPLVYDESLSYYEVLCKVFVQLEDFAKMLDDISKDVLDASKAYTDAQIEQKMLSLHHEYELFTEYVNERLAEMQETTDERFRQVNEEFLAVYNRISEVVSDIDEQFVLARNDYIARDGAISAEFNAKVVALRNEVVESVNNLQEQIDELEFQLPDVYNIVRGYETSIVQLIYDVYEACRYNAYTCSEFDGCGLSASELDNKEITAYEWDVNGRKYIIPEGMCLNPITGELDTYCHIFQSLAQDAHIDTVISCTEYDNLELTADVYDGKNLTAYYFDFYGKAVLVA